MSTEKRLAAMVRKLALERLNTEDVLGGNHTGMAIATVPAVLEPELERRKRKPATKSKAQANTELDLLYMPLASFLIH